MNMEKTIPVIYRGCALNCANLLLSWPSKMRFCPAYSLGVFVQGWLTLELKVIFFASATHHSIEIQSSLLNPTGRGRLEKTI